MVLFFLASVCAFSQQPPKMDSCPFWTHVAPVILTKKCLRMDVATVNAIIYVCRSVLHMGVAVLILYIANNVRNRCIISYLLSVYAQFKYINLCMDSKPHE